MPRKGEQKNLAELFIQSKTDFAIDPEPEPPREKKLLSEELKAKLKERRASAISATTTSSLAPAPAPAVGDADQTEVADATLDSVTPTSSSTPKASPSSTDAKDALETSRNKMGSGTDFVSFDADEEDAGKDDGAELQNVMSFPPWAKHSYHHMFRDNHFMLHEEIVDWMQYMYPRKAEHALRYVLVNRLVDLLSRGKEALFPEAKCHVFGSLRTGLLLPSSDVDMCVTGINSCSIREALDRISARLELLEICAEKPRVIEAKVQIVKFTDRLSKIECDISINSINGRHNTHMVKRLLDKYPLARPLILIIKTFLRQRLMNEVFTGGLSSYSISLMVIHLLQMFHSDPSRAAERRNLSLGRLLIEFFYLYGWHFNYDRCVLSIRGGGSYVHRDEYNLTNAPMPRRGNPGIRITIGDPQCPTNDVSGGSREMPMIKTAFQNAYLILTTEMRPPKPREVHAEHKNIFMRPTLLNRILEVDRELLIRRDALEGAYEEYLCGNPVEGEDQEFVSDYEEESCTEVDAVGPASPTSNPSSGFATPTSSNASTPRNPRFPPPSNYRQVSMETNSGTDFNNNFAYGRLTPRGDDRGFRGGNRGNFAPPPTPPQAHPHLAMNNLQPQFRPSLNQGGSPLTPTHIYFGERRSDSGNKRQRL